WEGGGARPATRTPPTKPPTGCRVRLAVDPARGAVLPSPPVCAHGLVARFALPSRGANLTNATDGPPLANRLEGLSPPKVRLAPPVMVASPATPPTLPRLPSPAKLLVPPVPRGAPPRAGAMMNDRCLWIDESMLALNLIERTPAQLFEPLDWNQGAPVGFLLAAKASIAVFGPSEFGLRFVPFLGSVIGLALFAGVSRRLLPAPAALLATGLMAVSPYLLSH